MLKGRIPVEPLDEDRLVQIERRIVAGAAERLTARAPASRRTFAWGAMALAMAAAVLVGWQLRGAPSQPAKPSEPQTFAMRTSAQRSVLDLGDATIATEHGSTVDISRTPERVVIEMARGRIEMAVVHREGRVVVVRAGETEIEDVGTKFAVTYDGASAVDVRVTEGSVKVTKAHASVMVAAGYAWTSDRGKIAIAELERAEQAVVAAAATTGPVAAAEPAKPAGASAAPAPPPAAPAPAHPHIEHAVEHPAVTARPAAPNDPYVELKVAIRSQPIEHDPKLDGQGDAAAEVARLKPIAYSPQKYGDEASLALYRMAVLLYKPLHQDSEALRTIDMYRRRFHPGKEVAAVLWLRVRITCGHAIDDECRQAAYTYQHEVPSGPAAEVAIRVTNAQ